MWEGAKSILVACQDFASSCCFDTFNVYLNLQPLTGSVSSSSQQVINFRIPGLNDDFQTFWDDKECNSVLDALVATPPAMSDPNPIYNLSLYKVGSFATSYLYKYLTRCLT